MNPCDMLRIQIPASTANLGPGFDSIGMALGLYLTIDATRSDQWIVQTRNVELQQLPNNEENYIVQVAKEAAAYFGCMMPPCKLDIASEIPLARGLGSSSSAIIAAIELVNAFCQLELSQEEKFRFATLKEGHPDNAGATIYGGMAIGIQCDEHTELISLPLTDVFAIVTIPTFELKTEKARAVLPETVDYRQAITSSAAANVLVAAAASGDFGTVGKMMELDYFHEPFRTSLIPHLASIKAIAKAAGAYGTAISGAGPTVITLAAEEYGYTIVDKIKEAFPEMIVRMVPIVNEGPIIKVYDSI